MSIESVLNGVFFAKGSEFGLIGGIGTAIGISIVNVMFAYLIGLGPARFINHRNIIIRSFAFLVTLSGIACLIALHAFAVHFRDAMAEVSESRALEVAIQSLLHTPWSVHSLSSAYLFGLGIFFAVGSFWKGYRFDDPFPFYGAKYRRVEALRTAYTDEHRSLFDDLESVREEIVEKVGSGMTTIPLFPQRAAQIRAQRVAQLEAFRAYESSVERAANQLLRIYRDANERSRKTPAPSHFREEWTLPHSFLALRQSNSPPTRKTPSRTYQRFLKSFDTTPTLFSLSIPSS